MTLLQLRHADGELEEVAVVFAIGQRQARAPRNLAAVERGILDVIGGQHEVHRIEMSQVKRGGHVNRAEFGSEAPQRRVNAICSKVSQEQRIALLSQVAAVLILTEIGDQTQVGISIRASFEVVEVIDRSAKIKAGIGGKLPLNTCLSTSQPAAASGWRIILAKRESTHGQERPDITAGKAWFEGGSKAFKI